MTDPALSRATFAPDTLTALAELVSRTTRVRWTPALEALALRAVWRHALLESGRVRVRVLRRAEETVRWTSSGVRGAPCAYSATHSRALVHVEGEDEPRWIDASRIVAVVSNGKARAAGTAGPVTGPEKEIR